MNTVLLHDNYGINQDGHFTVGGYDTVRLAEKYGTPLYLLDEQKVRAMCKTYLENAAKYFKNAHISFASKALSFKGIYRLIGDEGLYADTVSVGEIYTALEAGFPAERIHFHGNNKTEDDIRYAVSHHIGAFIVDNQTELDTLENVLTEEQTDMKILLRVTPGIDPHTHAKIATGKVDSKFGTAIETGQALDLVRYALTKKHCHLEGIHCHVGSQSFDPGPFLDAADILMRFMAQVKNELGYTLHVLNLGGGFGVRYLPEQQNLDIGFMFEKMAAHIQKSCEMYGLPEPCLHFEPGRSIVGAAGVTLYTVGNIKTIPGYKSYISVDGGMADNPRYTLYQAPYYCLLANKADKDRTFVADIAGRCCESGDLLQEKVHIQEPQVGDILAVCVTGAYNYSMASNYNRLPRPALVMLGKDKAYVGVRRESLEDLVRNDL